ncbi:ABC transporter substrate-binding protein, partial [Bordetella bronchiseptica]
MTAPSTSHLSRLCLAALLAVALPALPGAAAQPGAGEGRLAGPEAPEAHAACAPRARPARSSGARPTTRG